MHDEPPLIEGHTSKAFDGDLASLHVHVIEMGGLVLEQVRAAAQAYTEWKVDAAQRVIEGDRAVNGYERDIEAEQFKLIARRAPVASDLRAIVALARSVAELERAGDEAKKVARTVLGHGGRPGPATSRDVRHLGRLAASLLRLSLEALDRLDFEMAEDVIAQDRELDAEYADGLRRLLTRAMENPRHFEVALEAAFVLKAFERIGDHARNLARNLLTIARETPVRHSATA